MHEVVIVGAGAAGLAAALELQKAGIDFVILEARDRAGGRMFTIKSEAGNKIELGAELVHGLVPELINLVKAANLKVVQANDDHLALEQRKLVNANQYFQNTNDILASMTEYAESGDMSFAQFGRLITEQRPRLASALEQATGYVEDLNACYAEKVGIDWLAKTQRASDETEGYKFFRLLDGYGALVDYLVAQLPAGKIEFDRVVRKIAWKKNEVVLEISSGDGQVAALAARSALITLPVSILQIACLAAESNSAVVRFEPPLDQKLEALRSIELGRACRLSLEFRSRFWSEMESLSNFGFIHSRSLPFTTWWSQAPDPAPVLVAWAAGPKADKLFGKAKSELGELVMQSLAEVLEMPLAELREELVEIHFHDWTSDPFTQGAYSHVKANGMKAAKDLALPIDSTLFFAGEATDTDGFSGTVSGAVKSGIRAAKELLQVLR